MVSAKMDDTDRDPYESLESYLASRGMPLNSPLEETKEQEQRLPKAGDGCSSNSKIYFISFDEAKGLEAAILTANFRWIHEYIHPPLAWREARCKHERLPDFDQAKELLGHL